MNTEDVTQEELEDMQTARRLAEYRDADPDQMFRNERPFRFHENEA